ncbi:MAG TPA: SDR family NAD(P)-dependent oxidoreductase [Candidatus Dormibacteraeota bacterium]
MRLRGAAVLITGASSGIGEATALEFARRKARLALCARRLDRLQAVAEKCREAGAPTVTIRRADVSRRAEARAFVAAALRDLDRVDVLVNNAGTGWSGRFHEMPEEAVLNLVNTNMLGLIWATQAALPPMLAQHAGVVINVGSNAGVRALPYSSTYSATKFALTGLGHALRGELSGSGVKVVTVYPYITRTDFDPNSGPVGPSYSAAFVAASIVRAARFPRRDVMHFPGRLAHIAEPFLGGPLDHLLGEIRRSRQPELSGPGDLPEHVAELD